VWEHKLNTSSPRLKFLNFKFKKERTEKLCGWFRCRLEHVVFQLFERGHWNIRMPSTGSQPQTNGADKPAWSTSVIVDRKFSMDAESILRECAFQAFQDNHLVRACFACEHYDHWGNGECAKLRTPVRSQDALRCQYFEPRDSEDLMNIFQDL